MTQTVTELSVTSMEAAEDALAYARTAMLPAFSVTYAPKIPFPANREDLCQTIEYELAPSRAAERLPELMDNVFGKEAGGFASAQQCAFSRSSSMYPFIRKAQLDAAAE